MDFLRKTVERNRGLVKEAADLHQRGIIPPNTVVIDLDTIEKNAELIKSEADKRGLSNYFMTKQLGRNPLVSKVLADQGMKAVAVDIEGAKSLDRYGIPVGHVGHLCQIPKHDIEYVLREIEPEVITLYSFEMAKIISEKARELGKVQDVMIRVVGEDDFFYPHQKGGIPEGNLLGTAEDIDNLKGLKVVGTVSFPCLRFNIKNREEEVLPNLKTIVRAASKLERELGMEISQINAPADTSVRTLEILDEEGATHGEPGHGFTGTTPWHAFEELPEAPAWVYVSEISHKTGDRAFAYGGAFMSSDAPLGIWDELYHHYRVRSLVGSDPETIFENEVTGEVADYLDYYSALYPGSEDDLNVGDTAVYGFRNQVFVSRAKVAVLRGLSGSGNPEMLGLFDRTGNLLRRDDESPKMADDVDRLINSI